MRISRISIAVTLLAILLIAGFMTWRLTSDAKPPIRIGVLHSLTGTMALNETQLVNVVRLAVEEINARGGLLGQPLQMVVADTKSDPNVATVEAERLISQEKVSVLFGCWTSSCRKAVKPVVEKHKHLLFYPVQYEGMEQSPNILYTGAAPNQQIVPGTRWAMQQFGRRAYLVGSDYVFPRTANIIIRDLVQAGDGEIIAERYVPLGSAELSAIVEDIRRAKPDVVFNTINGDSNAAFFAALEKAGLKNIPLMSFSVAELGMKRWGGNRLTQHYGVWSYFQSLPGASNRRFVAAYQSRFGADQMTNDPIEAAYVGVRLWAQTVRIIHSSEPEYVNPALLQQSIASPSGIMAVDSATRHVWKFLRVGKVRPDAQFEQVYASDMPLRPSPWPDYRSRAEWQALIEGGKP
jgi:urea transport system substrate-binding protein